MLACREWDKHRPVVESQTHGKLGSLDAIDGSRVSRPHPSPTEREQQPARDYVPLRLTGTFQIRSKMRVQPVIGDASGASTCADIAAIERHTDDLLDVSLEESP